MGKWVNLGLDFDLEQTRHDLPRIFLEEAEQ